MNLNERLGYQQAIGTNLEALCKLDKRVSTTNKALFGSVS